MGGLPPRMAGAQVPPSLREASACTGLLAAAHVGDLARLKGLIDRGAALDIRDTQGRAAIHVATYARHHDAIKLLANAGADLNAFDVQRYDPVTIAAVANDEKTLAVLLQLGASARNVTSPYDGTALIAAAHLGHVGVVRQLITAGANRQLADREGNTPLARARGYPAIIRLLEH